MPNLSILNIYQKILIFSCCQIYQIGASSSHDSHVDRVFKQALREFKDNLVATYSVAAHQSSSETLNIKYKDLIVNFLQVILTTHDFIFFKKKKTSQYLHMNE